MIRSASQLIPDESLQADVVVVGAGPLGIIVALELGDAGHRVLLIESGAKRFSESAQDLSASVVELDDPWHVARELAVRRQLGGTSVLWGGRCVPFDPLDFEPRPVVPERLWPLGYSDIEPYFQQACDWMRCGQPIFDAGQEPRLAHRSMLAGFSDDDVRTTALERWSLPTRFGRLYRRRLERHRNVTVVLDLTCTALRCNPDTGRVDGLALASLGGLRTRAVGRHYVLATGGVEATRLMLSSNDVHRAGIGNATGHLGCWYMAHVEARVATMHLSTPPTSTIYEHERDSDGVYVRRRITISPEVQHREELPNAAMWIVNPPMGDPSHGNAILSGVYLTLTSPVGKYLLADAIRIAGTKTPGGVSRRAHLRNILENLGAASRFAASFSWRRILKPGRKAPGFFVGSAANAYPINYHGEHLPHRESRVWLGTDRDALGVPRAQTSLVYSEADILGVRKSLQKLDLALQAHNVGHLRFHAEDVEAAVWEQLTATAGYHQTGTTRLAANRDQGVVDRNLAVFDADNLYIASTSTFPTSSQANPTFMGAAFAVRLAEHLSRELKQR